jgi:hypothetical protein
LFGQPCDLSTILPPDAKNVKVQPGSGGNSRLDLDAL